MKKFRSNNLLRENVINFPAIIQNQITFLLQIMQPNIIIFSSDVVKSTNLLTNKPLYNPCITQSTLSFHEKLSIIKYVSLYVRPEPTRVQHLQGGPLQGRLLALLTNIRLGWKGLISTIKKTFVGKNFQSKIFLQKTYD